QCFGSIPLLGSSDNIQEGYSQQIHREVFRHSLPYDTSQLYGLPFVSSDNIPVSTINGVGTVIESIYILIFIIFAPKKQKAKIIGLFTTVLAVFSIVVFVSLFALHGNSRKFFCGFASAICSIIMYGSPLSIMRLVMRTKSVEFMPFYLSLSVFLCGTSWFIFGLLGHDPFLAVPNGVGSALGALQLILYFIYRDNKGAQKKQTPIEEETIEMGHTRPNQEKQSNANGIRK
ncbi:hypothetical protein Lal_00020081, partial [Lupinus albus]